MYIYIYQDEIVAQIERFKKYFHSVRLHPVKYSIYLKSKLLTPRSVKDENYWQYVTLILRFPGI